MCWHWTSNDAAEHDDDDDAAVVMKRKMKKSIAVVQDDLEHEENCQTVNNVDIDYYQQLDLQHYALFLLQLKMNFVEHRNLDIVGDATSIHDLFY